MAQSSLTLTNQQLLYEVLGYQVDVPGPVDLAQEDGLVEGEPAPGEGRETSQELEGEDTEGPPVHTLVVSLLQDDLRRHVVRGPALRQAPLPIQGLPGEPEVCYHDVAVLLKQYVLWLQVSAKEGSVKVVRESRSMTRVLTSLKIFRKENPTK